MRLFLKSSLIAFLATASLSSCSKQASVTPSTQQETTPPLVTHADSLITIPDINTEYVTDLRSIEQGSTIYRANYVDQPGMVQLSNGSWACVFTTSSGSEGTNGQHVVLTRSSDMGATWSKPSDIEPVTGISSGWAMPYLTGYGRLYVFYVYNGDNFTQYNGVSLINSNLLGWYCYKYSDDMGQTWSKRYRMPIKMTAVDRNNTFKGAAQMLWSICKPLHTNRGLLFSFTKMGQFVSGLGEGWLMNCPNIETEKNADNLDWITLPDGDVGIKNPAWNIQEEHNIVQLSNGSLYCVNRTQQGYPAFSTSNDFGSTWTIPTAMKYGSGSAADRIIKNPLACARIFKCKNGNYLLWYHNNGTTGYENRNPVWMSGGVEVNGTIWWSEPEVVLYSSAVANRFSYPDLIEQQGRYFFAESSKTAAMLHEVNPNLLTGLWYQLKRKATITSGIVLDYDVKGSKTNDANNNLFTSLNFKGGFTLDFMLKFNTLGTANQIFSNKDSNGKGVSITTTANKTLLISINDGSNSSTLETDPNLLTTNTTHHIAFTVDGASNIITAMIDGKLCDGGSKKAFGWVRFGAVSNVNTDNQLVFGSSLDGEISSFKIYGRALRTSELVSNYLAAK
ncbi:exo-alpha-sialidase [Mucilaginibacter auburnensis]|uniref:BNR repeat protein n=1 Tax=Mucilaginibacter auburnensis TaxID=1457233 RepID=A0A2H9VTC3_9SPHI|nr:LamG-like jellyroll fold domain-containing protein [Mucilaginibacter auburnensis]PJJ84054.1 BNR repeat protein [Mucilaginibacter auburnensis]